MKGHRNVTGFYSSRCTAQVSAGLGCAFKERWNPPVLEYRKDGQNEAAKAGKVLPSQIPLKVN